MAVDKRTKKKKKREEKQKARRQDVERAVRREKAEDYEWEARDAYHRQEYRQALHWAQKKLRLYPDDEGMRGLAYRCAVKVDDFATQLTMLRQWFQEDDLHTKEDYYALGCLAFRQKNYRLAAQVLDALLSDVNAEEPKLSGWLSKTRLKDAQKIALFSRNLIKSSADAGPGSPGGRSAERGSTAGPHRPETLPENGLPPGAQPPASPVSPRDASVRETLPELKVSFVTDAEPLLQPSKLSGSRTVRRWT